MHALSKSRLFRSLTSSVSLRTNPFACLFEVTSVSFACFLSQSKDMPLCVSFRGHVCFVRLLPQSVRGHAPLSAFSNSRLLRTLASSVCLWMNLIACLFVVTSVSFACFLSQSTDKPLCVPCRSHVCFVDLLPQSVRGHAPRVPFRCHVCFVHLLP